MATTTVDLDEYRQLVSTNDFLTSEAKRFSKEAHDTKLKNEALESELKIVREKRDFWEESSAFQKGVADQRWNDLQSAYKDRNLWKDRFKAKNKDFEALKEGFVRYGIELVGVRRELLNLKAKYDLDQE